MADEIQQQKIKLIADYKEMEGTMAEMANFVKLETNLFFEKTVAWAVEDGKCSKDDAINDLREVKALEYEAHKVADLLRIGRSDFNVGNTTTESTQKFKKDEEKLVLISLKE
jgi:hypothetical protein